MQLPTQVSDALLALRSARVWFVVWLVVLGAVFCSPVPAAVPIEAAQYKRTLIRAAQHGWGLDAPVATMAAQVHQESMWRSNARSPAGAQGLAQFMPATAHWMAELYPASLGPAQPFNPGWALRAMVAFDLWLYERNQTAASECDRWAFVLSGYNGGQGWVNRDRKLASAKGADQRVWFDSVERFNAGRSAANFRENRHYPRAILLRWTPMYEAAGWGTGVCADRYSRHETTHRVFVDSTERQRACSVFAQLVECRRVLRIAASPRAAHQALTAQVQS